ncbi:unnamed protein product [Rotaria sp. Silwood1]|nr:unnamed protein product [Rotaria sp. Silwood1]
MNRFGDIDASFQKLPPVYGYRSEKLVPIEKALEPIESQIDELPYYIKIAQRHCHFPSEHGLTRDQSAAIYIYTMEWGDTTLYRVLNKALRSENRQALKIWFPYLKLFDTALDKLPTVKEAVWRGVSLDIGKNFTKNQIVTWWSVNSCSSSVNVIKDFLGNNKNSTLFLIEAVNGKKISGYTEYEQEDEVILRMGSQFRVKSDPLDQSNDSHLVHLIEIDDNNDQPLASAMNDMQLAAVQPSIKSISVSTLASLVLLSRVVWQKRRMQQRQMWKKNRRLLIQLLYIVILHNLVWLPMVICWLIIIFSPVPQPFLVELSINILPYGIYIVILVCPFVSLISLPELWPRHDPRIVPLTRVGKSLRPIAPLPIIDVNASTRAI